MCCLRPMCLNLSAAIQKFSGGDEVRGDFSLHASEADAEDTAGADADSAGRTCCHDTH